MKRTEDESFKNLISKSRLELPNPGFEEQVMTHILAEHALRERSLPMEIKWSWVLVALIALLGIGTSLVLGQLRDGVFGLHPHTLKTVFEFIFIVFVLMQVDTLVKYTFRRHSIHLTNGLRET